MRFFYNKIKSWHSVFQLGRFAMTNAEYMEYEGYGLIEAALYSYTATADGSDLFSLAESRPGAGPSEGFLWDYILFRLYLAEKHILRFPSGFGCMTSMAEGLREGLSHLSLTLSTLSTLRSLNGSFLVVGSGRLPDRNHVERRFSDFRRMEKEASHSIENMIAAIASLSGEKVDGHMISLFSEETRAFLSLVSGKLSSLPPCHIYRRARSFTPALPSLSEEAAVYPSFLAFLTGLAVSCLVMLM